MQHVDYSTRNIGVSDRADVYIGHMHLVVVVWFEKVGRHESAIIVLGVDGAKV
jgi:hypothetical protein